VVVGDDRLDDLRRLAGTFDEPFADPAAVPTAVLSSLARESVTVVLSGDGGDETHAGYPRYRRMRQLGWIDRVPLLLRRGLFSPLAALAPSYRRRGGLEQVTRDAVDRYDAMTRELPPVHRRAIYTDQFKERLRGLRLDPSGGARPWRRRAFAELSSSADMLDRVQRLDLLTYLPEQLMTKLDRTSMAVSLEARVPLLDLEAVELAARVPPDRRMADGRPKYLLRKLLESRMGVGFGDRPKRGFTVPQHRWIGAQPTASLREVLLPEGVEAWLDPAKLTRHVLESPRGIELAWPLLVFAHWFRAYQPSG
jgi:asparagine synthase (glutamine-hydrolysing)